MTKPLFITIPANEQGLKDAVERIRPDDEPLRRMVERRIEREQIRIEYRRLRGEGKTKEEAYKTLSEDKNLSEGAIDKIVYRRNKT